MLMAASQGWRRDIGLIITLARYPQGKNPD